MMPRPDEGCTDGNCILREEQLRQHTNGGCRCFRDIPTLLRIAIQRRIVNLKDQVKKIDKATTDNRAKLDAIYEAYVDNSLSPEEFRSVVADIIMEDD